MPMAFPPISRGPDWFWADSLMTVPVAFDISNVGNVGMPFDWTAFDPGLVIRLPVNLRSLGYDYEDVTLGGLINKSDPDAQPPTQTLSTVGANWALTGVTRDSGGVALGSCSLDLYITGADILAYGGVSDASGNFSFGNPGSGPFYIVAYKVGSPDVAGTTVNTLTPSLVS